MSTSHSTDKLISSWLEPSTRVLDLGCGDGSLLRLLEQEKKISGVGVEIDENQVATCIEDGLQVIQADIENGLDIFKERSYDCVVMSQTLQELHDPAKVLREMLRVGKQAIVSIANAGHWTARLSFLSGTVPSVTGADKQDLKRLITVSDFQQLCIRNHLHIQRQCYISRNGETSNGLFARSAVYMLETKAS